MNKKCYRFGCTNPPTGTVKYPRSLCYGEPVCEEHVILYVDHPESSDPRDE